MEKIIIGKVGSAFGIKGQVRINNFSHPKRFEELENIIIGGKSYKIVKVDYKGEMPILTLENINTRNDSEALRNQDIKIREEDLPRLDEGEFFIKDLIGLEAINSETGQALGKIKDVLQHGPTDIYVIGGEKDILVPAAKDFVKEIDIEEGKIYINVIEGLID